MRDGIRAYNWRTEGDTRLSANFKVREFKCGEETVTFISMPLVEALQKLRDAAGRSVNITSGYRNRAQNTKAGGSGDSLHLYGAAADLYVSGMSARETGKLLDRLFPASCIGVYETSGHVHFHLQPTRSRYVVDRNGKSRYVSGF